MSQVSHKKPQIQNLNESHLIKNSTRCFIRKKNLNSFKKMISLNLFHSDENLSTVCFSTMYIVQHDTSAIRIKNIQFNSWYIFKHHSPSLFRRKKSFTCSKFSFRIEMIQFFFRYKWKVNVCYVVLNKTCRHQVNTYCIFIYKNQEREQNTIEFILLREHFIFLFWMMRDESG